MPDTVVSPAETPEELIERLRGAANYGFGNLNEDQRNLYRAAADAIESRNALLHGADVDHAALLAVGERDKAERAQFLAAALDYKAQLAEALSVGERDRRQIARLTERDDWLLKQIDGCIESAEAVATMVGLALARAVVGDLRDARSVLADEEDAHDEDVTPRSDLASDRAAGEEDAG